MMERRLKRSSPSCSVHGCSIDEKEYLRLGLLLEQLFEDAEIQMVSSVINPSGAKRDNVFSFRQYIFFVILGDQKVSHPKGDGLERKFVGGICGEAFHQRTRRWHFAILPNCVNSEPIGLFILECSSAEDGLEHPH